MNKFKLCQTWRTRGGNYVVITEILESGQLPILCGDGALRSKDGRYAGVEDHPDDLLELVTRTDDVSGEQHLDNSTIEKTLSERGERYGDFKDHATISQVIKEAMQTWEGWEKLDNDQKEALEMIAHKIARILNGDPNYADSWHDIAGYATLVEKRLNNQKVG